MIDGGKGHHVLQFGPNPAVEPELLALKENHLDRDATEFTAAIDTRHQFQKKIPCEHNPLL